MIAAPATLDLSAAIHDQTYPAHPCFPQLRTANQPHLMLELLREHLKPADSLSAKTLHIEECVPVRFGFRRSGKRCALQYALRLAQHDEASHLISGPNLSKLWITCVIYAEADEATKAYTELEQVDFKIQHPWRTFEPLTHIPELQMVVYVFPCDPAMLQLARVLGGTWPELQEPLLASFGPGQWQIEHETTEPLRYRTEDSAVVRYTVRAGRSGASGQVHTRRFYAKVNRTRYGRDICQLLRHIRNGAAAARNNFSVVEPIFYCNERRCLVLAEAPGRSLQDLLKESDETLTADSTTALLHVARAMSAFSQSEIPTLVRHSAEEQIRWLNRTAQLLCWACPSSSALLKATVKEIAAGLTDVPHVPIQWDLKPDHVFVDGDRVILIDLDTVSFGDPARDPAHLAAHIACRIDLPPLAEKAAHVAARILLAEYFAHVPSSWREQLNLQCSIAILEAACGLFKRQEAGWSARAATAIQHAQLALSGKFP